jgi:hypothetical protein
MGKMSQKKKTFYTVQQETEAYERYTDCGIHCSKVILAWIVSEQSYTFHRYSIV